MDDQALLARIDRRLDLTEEHIRQAGEHMRRGNDYMRESRAAIQDNTSAIDDLRTALDQWNLRQETMMREVLAATQEMIASMREWRYEGVEEGRAQRAALFAILDELKGRGGPATA